MQPTESPSVPELVDAWEAVLLTPLTLCADLSEQQWSAATPCPGWSVGDVVAHMADVEGVLAGLDRPVHTPDWDSLPHVQGDVGRFTEVGVDAARGTPRADVLAGLHDVAQVRRSQLDALDDDAQVISPFGRPTSLERLVRMRTFDLWAHEQDIRAGLGLDGDWSSDAAVVSYQQISKAMLAVWPSVEPPVGSVVHVIVTGPGVAGEIWAANAGEGRGVVTESVSEPHVTLELSWPDYARLSCGRITAADARDRVKIHGDIALGERLLAELAITP